jgi:hypothetical protein
MWACNCRLFQQGTGPGTHWRPLVQTSLPMWLVRELKWPDGYSTLGRMLVATAGRECRYFFESSRLKWLSTSSRLRGFLALFNTTE